MKNIGLFISSQFIYLLLIILAFVIPLALIFEYSPYDLPYIQYFFLIMLVLSQYAFFKDSHYIHSNREKIINQLMLESGKHPSKGQIVTRSNQWLSFRGVSIGICAFLIIIVMFVYKKI